MVIWLHFLYNSLPWLEPTEEVLVFSGFLNFLFVSLEVKLVQKGLLSYSNNTHRYFCSTTEIEVVCIWNCFDVFKFMLKVKYWSLFLSDEVCYTCYNVIMSIFGTGQFVKVLWNYMGGLHKISTLSVWKMYQTVNSCCERVLQNSLYGEIKSLRICPFC